MSEEAYNAVTFDEFRKLVREQSDFLNRMKYIKDSGINQMNIGTFEGYIDVFAVEKNRMIEQAGKALYEDRASLDKVLAMLKTVTSPGAFSQFEGVSLAMFDHARQIYFHSDQMVKIYEAVDIAQSAALDRLFKGKDMTAEDTTMIAERLKSVRKALEEIDGIVKRYERAKP